MQTYNIGLTCLQETHQRGSAHFITDGFLVIYSGTDRDEREWAGVGFIVAPWVRHSVQGFVQSCSRMASINVRISGGSVCFISAYAPHNEHDLTTRADFFSDLAVFARQCRPHGPTFILGDLNARINYSKPGEESVFGEHIFANPLANTKPHSNRDLLFELCLSNGYVVANTFIERPVEEKVTYFDLAAKPKDEISVRYFTELDHVLAQRDWMHKVLHVKSVRDAALQSHHFLVLVKLDLWIPKICRARRPPKLNIPMVLLLPSLNAAFIDFFKTEMEDKEELATVDLGTAASMVQTCMGKAASQCIPQIVAKAHRPWISQATLDLIENRGAARSSNQYQLEQALNKQSSGRRRTTDD